MAIPEAVSFTLLLIFLISYVKMENHNLFLFYFTKYKLFWKFDFSCPKIKFGN